MVAQVAEVLELPVSDLLRAAGYVDPAADSPDQLPRPVRPRATTLPLAALAPDRFEQFIADLAHLLYPGTTVHRFGGQGHKQGGVDVLVTRGAPRAEAGFQCKREKQFGPADVRKAVSDVTVSAKRYFLALTRVASPAARTEIQEHKGWTLLDMEDISRIVRHDLSRDASLRLVDAFFPRWREDFLGIREPGPWLTPDEFFLPFTGDQLFRHDWSLVGRGEILESILRLVGGDGQRIAALIGRGGIGKTRLLRAVAEAMEQDATRQVRFLAVGADVRPEHYELLPEGRSLVIIDDAHERRDLAELVASIKRASSGSKILLSLRPYGFNLLTHDLGRIGIHPSELPNWELGDLKAHDAEALAREILGSDFDSVVVTRLARLTADCPLVTVLGAGLLKRGALDPGSLEADESVREQILRSYRDALVSDPAAGDPELRRAVLDGIAILQPLKLDESAFRGALEELTGVPFDRICPHLRGLEDAGVLLRRGQQIRIIPDLLGDVILWEACFDDRSGVSTGYIERTQHAASGEALQNIFVNASRLDWQVSQGTVSGQPLVESLWATLEAEFRDAGIQGRRALLALLKRGAFFQPARALNLARWALENPTSQSEDADHPLARLYPPTYEDILRELPPVLRDCAYSLDHLREASDLLWELAQRDGRPTNQYPDHALRVLTELAEYRPGKPLAYNEAMVDAAETWLERQDTEDLLYSPFDVLEPLLGTEGSDQSADGFTLSFKPYGLNVPVVKPARDRVIQLALREARHPDPRRTVRAIKSIGASLHYPMGMFGRHVAAKERQAWTPVFRETLQQLREVAADQTLDPVVGVAIRGELKWHVHYSTSGTQAAASKVVAAIPESAERELALLLYDGWGRILFDHREDFEAAEEEKQARFRKLADALASEYEDRQIVDLLDRRLNVQQRAFGPGGGSPGQFVWALVEAQPSVGEVLCRSVTENPDSALREVLPVALSPLATNRGAVAVAAAQELLSTGVIEVVRGVAASFGWNRGGRSELIEGEMALLEEFAQHEDAWVRRSAVRAAQGLMSTHRTRAISLLCAVRFDNAPQVAEDVFATFGARGDDLKWRELAESQRTTMLEQLALCPSIDEHHVTQFLNEVAAADPLQVVELLIARVVVEESQRLAEYRALPFNWRGHLNIKSHPKFTPTLRRIRDWIAENPDSWQRQRSGGEMFRVAAGTFDQQVVALLKEVLDTGSRGQIEAVAIVIRGAPRQLIWEQVPFIAHLLQAAARYGEGSIERVGGHLHAAVTEGARSGVPGQPFPEDVEQRDRSAQIAGKLPRGSIEERFYRSLLESAEASIRWSADRDEQLLDHREW